VRWVGWPGLVPRSKNEARTLREQMVAQGIHPVFMTRAEVESFYGGFCNKTIWPLFHYFTMHASYQRSDWEAYRRLNQVYADLLLGQLRPGDSLMVNDYHLMLVPRLVKEALPGLTTYFFLHIPFPTFEIFRLLPSAWRLELLRGMIAADVVGFHTSDYTSYFLHCVQSLLGYSVHAEGRVFRVAAGRQDSKVGTFPLGIDFDRFDTLARRPDRAERAAEIQQSAKLTTIILSVDRLDYTKGITNRLRGYELFLSDNPDWLGRVTLLMLVTPSREAVEHYQQMKRQIDEMVGAINGRFATLEWTPILYQYKSLPLEALSPYYTASHVALVTPIRDGMNLVAKEFVASHPDNRGVLILSEMAGAAEELREALLVNPNSVEEIAGALKQAVTMNETDQCGRMARMRKRLRRYNIFRWAEDFFESA
jgi:trehalose 6-phosphate synthase/phosphatase